MPSKSMQALLERLGHNGLNLQQSYATANDLLAVAVMDALPWVIALPEVRRALPGPMQAVLPPGRKPTLEAMEQLATRLVAILDASYRAQGSPWPDPEPPTAGPAHGARVQQFR